jgi:hypothetical protein
MAPTGSAYKVAGKWARVMGSRAKGSPGSWTKSSLDRERMPDGIAQEKKRDSKKSIHKAGVEFTLQSSSLVGLCARAGRAHSSVAGFFGYERRVWAFPDN